MLVSGANELEFQSADHKVIHKEINIKFSALSEQYLVYGNYKNIHFYHTAKKKKMDSLCLSHELETTEELVQARANSSEVVVLTSQHKLILVNYSSVVLATFSLNQHVNDFLLSSSGQVVTVGSSGTIDIIRVQRKENLMDF